MSRPRPHPHHPGRRKPFLARFSSRREEQDGAQTAAKETDIVDAHDPTAAREEQSARQAVFERRTDRARGLVLGLALGESVGLHRHRHPPITAGVGTQLAAFTLEGYIRAAVRMAHKGICHPPTVMWRAYRRWAIGQGITLVHDTTMPASFTDPLDGWLCHVPALRERRGDAPTTVAALRGGRPGTIEEPLNPSMGWHGLVRVLPVAVGATGGYVATLDLARRAAALTHGSPLGLDVTCAAVAITAACLRPGGVSDGLRDGVDAVRGLGVDARLVDALTHVMTDAVSGPSPAPASLVILRALAPDQTSQSALAGGLFVAATRPDPDRFLDALELAAQAPDGAAVAAVAGALLGASHGASQLPVDLVSRHELAWALDTLARDAVAQLVDSPGGSEYFPARDEHWRSRYPGS